MNGRTGAFLSARVHDSWSSFTEPLEVRGSAFRFRPGAAHGVYFLVFLSIAEPAMEAERLNAIAAKIEDLKTRGLELRRYL